MSSGISSAIARSGGSVGEPRTFTHSPPRNRDEALAAASLTKIFSSEIRCCTRARLVSASLPAKNWSRRLPASSAAARKVLGKSSIDCRRREKNSSDGYLKDEESAIARRTVESICVLQRHQGLKFYRTA